MAYTKTDKTSICYAIGFVESYLEAPVTAWLATDNDYQRGRKHGTDVKAGKKPWPGRARKPSNLSLARRDRVVGKGAR